LKYIELPFYFYNSYFLEKTQPIKKIYFSMYRTTEEIKRKKIRKSVFSEAAPKTRLMAGSKKQADGGKQKAPLWAGLFVGGWKLA